MQKIIEKSKLPSDYINQLKQKFGFHRSYWNNLVNGHLRPAKKRETILQRQKHMRAVYQLQEEWQEELKAIQLLDSIKVKREESPTPTQEPSPEGQSQTPRPTTYDEDVQELLQEERAADFRAMMDVEKAMEAVA